MKTQKNRNHRTIMMIFAMSIIPFAIAWYFAKNPQVLKLGASNGDLVTPPVTTEFGEFSGYDSFTAENLKELQGHWVLVNPVPTAGCDASCEEGLYKTRQISLMMGKDISRIRRAAIVADKSVESVFNAQWQSDGHLLKILAAPSLQEKISRIMGDQVADGSLLIMDPLGNLMMRYPAGFDPYKVRNDLNKLLKISQIG